MFAITLVTVASFFDTVFRLVGAKYDLIPKRHYLLSSIIRGVVLTGMCLLTYFGVWPEVF